MDNQTDAREVIQPTPSTTDDESLSTSTASFESWTIINDKQKDLTTTQPLSSPSTSQAEDYVDNLSTETAMEASQLNAEEEQEDEPPPDYESATIANATDELSDEVSIISDSDGGETLSPHPYLLEHLHKLNLKFTTGEGLDLATLLQQQQQEEHRQQLERQQNNNQQESTPPNTPILLPRLNTNYASQIRQRKRRSPSMDASKKSLRNHQQTTIATDLPFINFRPSGIIKFICHVLNYILAAIVSLLFITFIFTRYFYTFPIPSSPERTLEDKINDMELQNNLMRAEIDFLSKQVYYLNTLRDVIENKCTWNEYHEKNKYNNYEAKESQIEKPTMDAYVEEVNKLLNTENSIKVENFEEDDLNIETNDELNEIPSEYITQLHGDNDETIRHGHIFQKQTNPPEVRRNDEEFHKLKERRNNFKEQNMRKERLNNKNNNKERNNKENKFKERYNDDSSEHENENNKNEHNNFKKHNKNPERNNNENSKEKINHLKFRKNKNNDDSGENEKSKEKKNRNDNSKERGNNFKARKNNNNNNNNNNDNSNEYKKQQKYRKSNSGERFGDRQQTGEWHEKLMQQREKARHEQEQNLQEEKNWYLNRRDSREQWRTDDLNR